MHEDILRTALHKTVDYIELPPSIWTNIQDKLSRRKTFFGFKKVVTIAIVTVLFCIISIGSITSIGATAQGSWFFKSKLGTFTLIFMQNVGKELAEVAPTLFLPTTLSHAKEVAKMEIKVPTYLPERVILGSETPTLVGRFGSYETSAIKVANKINGSDSEEVILDIRQTNASEITQNYPPDIKIIHEKIKINNNDGLLTVGDGIPPSLYWTDGKYCYRMFGPQDKSELIKIAESMK